MSEKKIVKMDFTSIREIWEREDVNFTPWLKENIEYLSDVLGFKLEPDITELRQNEGYRADLVAKDVDGNLVVIENQYNTSDHKHLGQLLVYCITLGAKIGIWLCENARQSHIEVIEWLNEKSPKDMAFYLVQMKVGKIEDFYIPIFEVLVKPRESKGIGKAKQDLTEIDLAYIKFWEEFLLKINEKSDLFRNISSKKRNFLCTSVGKGFLYCPNITKGSIRTELYFNSTKERNKQYFDDLIKYRTEIEEEFGDKLEWERLDAKIACRIRYFKEGISWSDEKNWDPIHDFLISNTIKLDNVFRKHLDKLS